MERKVNIQSNQKVTEEDFNNLGTYPRESMDHLVSDLGGAPAPRFTGYLVEQQSASQVRVGSGRFYPGDGSVFAFTFDEGQTIDFLDYLPAVAQRVATIVVYGTAIDTALEPRTFLVDATTRATEGREVATENRRQAYVGALYGAENPTPSPPAVPSDYVAVADVVLSPSGVVSITRRTANQHPSVHGNAESIGTINARLAQVGPQMDTLKTDISALGARLATKADQGFVNGLALDMARVKDRVDLPDDYATYGADYFLTEDESDTEHADYSARVEEGARFPGAAQQTVAIALENAIDAKVMTNNNMTMPRWSEVTRASVVGNDSAYPLANTTVETVEKRKVSETRTVRKYLGSETISTSSRWWTSGQYDATNGIFRRGDETFVVVDIDHYRKPHRVRSWFWWPWGWGWRWHEYTRVELRKYVDVTVTDTHWEEVSVTEDIQGSIAAQTILNSQDGYMTGVNLYFDKKAAAGNVRVLICDVDQTDTPMLGRVLAEETLTPADISVYPSVTRVAFQPVFMPKGSRFAIVLVSSGAHFVSQVHNNPFSQGVIRYMVDGQWQSGDPTRDFAFELLFARFDAPVVTVQLAPLELAGGIDSIAINADSSIPDGTAIEFEVRVNGVWRSLSEGAGENNFLSSHPNLVQFRAVFMGTTDVMPGLGLGSSRSAVTLVRPAANLTHISSPRLLPTPCDQVDVTLRVENWDADNHSLTVSLLTGASYATAETADAVVTSAAPDDPNARIISATFLVTDVEQFKIKLVGATGGSAQYFHVAERTDIEFVS